MKRTPLNRKSPLRRTPFFRKPAKKSQPDNNDNTEREKK